jgi:hypothetical protein
MKGRRARKAIVVQIEVVWVFLVGFDDEWLALERFQEGRLLLSIRESRKEAGRRCRVFGNVRLPLEGLQYGRIAIRVGKQFGQRRRREGGRAEGRARASIVGGPIAGFVRRPGKDDAGRRWRRQLGRLASPLLSLLYHQAVRCFDLDAATLGSASFWPQT